MKYLVSGAGGPGFSSPEEAVDILEEEILPTFAAIMKLEKEGKILAGGLPVGERSFVFIAEAASHDELDKMLRGIPAWGVFDWQVTPLQSFGGRAALEKAFVDDVDKTRH
jgi:muconolactone delta-isomerase